MVLPVRNWATSLVKVLQLCSNRRYLSPLWKSVKKKKQGSKHQEVFFLLFFFYSTGWRLASLPVRAFSQRRQVIHEDLLRHLCLSQLHHRVGGSEHRPTLTDTQRQSAQIPCWVQINGLFGSIGREVGREIFFFFNSQPVRQSAHSHWQDRGFGLDELAASY